MPRPETDLDARPEPEGERKIMVDVPPGLHRAVKMVALDEGWSASDVYAAAVEAMPHGAVERALLPPMAIPRRRSDAKTADAMTAVLRMMREAGSDGIHSVEMDRVLRAARIRSGTAEEAKDVLREAGLARSEKRRWHPGALRGPQNPGRGG